MQLNPAEISELIKSRIEGLTPSADIRASGQACDTARSPSKNSSASELHDSFLLSLIG